MSKARSTGNIGNIIKTSTTCVTVTDGTTDLLIMSGSGRVTIPGNLVVLGGIAGSSAESASYSLSSSFATNATNANLLDGIDGASFLQTGSFNTFSSSIDTTIKNKLNGDGVISGSVQVDITSTTGYSTFSSSLSSSIGSLSGSVATTTSGLSSSIGSLSSSVATTTSGLAGRIESVETKTGSYATTGSNVFVGNQVITGSICSNGNIVTTGQIVAQTINVQQVTSSIVYSCGSNIFGTDINNTQQFTGSMFITGSNFRATVGTACFSGNVCALAFVGGTVSGTSGTFSGDLTIDTNILYVDSTNDRVGIGLTTPSSKLHIQDSTATTTTINSFAIYGATKQLLFGFISDGTNITNGRIRTGGNIPLSLGTSSSNDALFITNAGNVGIGTNCPLQILHISATTPTLFLSDCAATGNGGNVYITAAKSGVGYNNLTMTAYTYNLKGGGYECSYLSINSTGAACFVSSVTANGDIIYNNVGNQNLIITSGAANNGRMYIYSAGNANIGFQAGGNSWFLNNVGIGTNSPSQLLDIVGTTPIINIQGGANSNARGIQFNYNGAFVIGSFLSFGGTGENALSAGSTGSSGYFLTLKTDGTERTRITSTGIACFACQVCAKSLITNAGGLTENFDATGGGHINRYFAVKYMSENATHAFFKITTSGASATYIKLVGTNAGVGWYSSQVYHAANSAYWGGWIGSGTQISLIGTNDSIALSI